MWSQGIHKSPQLFPFGRCRSIAAELSPPVAQVSARVRAVTPNRSFASVLKGSQMDIQNQREVVLSINLADSNKGWMAANEKDWAREKSSSQRVAGGGRNRA